MTTETAVRPTTDRPVRPQVAIILAAGLVLVVAYQASLTLGAPFGVAAMGGANLGTLPDEMRLVSGFLTLGWSFAALVVLARGGRVRIPVPPAVARAGTWVLVGLLGLGSVMNFASSSPWERWGWGPFTLIMFGLCLALARSGDRGRSAT